MAVPGCEMDDLTKTENMIKIVEIARMDSDDIADIPKLAEGLSWEDECVAPLLCIALYSACTKKGLKRVRWLLTRFGLTISQLRNVILKGILCNACIRQDVETALFFVRDYYQLDANTRTEVMFEAGLHWLNHSPDATQWGEFELKVLNKCADK